MQDRMSVIANNLANINTTAFKRDRASFEDLIYQNIRQVGANSTQDTELPSGLVQGTGVRNVATQKLHTQGNLVQTGNNLDVAIEGRGYFQILMPDGNINYTRDGTFALNQDGEMVTNSGYTLEPSISIPENALSVSVGSDGTVSALVAGDSTPTEVGTIELADFINPMGLEALGGNLYRETVSSGTPSTTTPGYNGAGTWCRGCWKVPTSTWWRKW